ncbi:methyltransferase [Vibrio methylphosphonaticus]|uniref:methyltransferase n=1 Tax=Vibrio methylphosphonaticus TaxID=2946866 RepID=UPI00202A85F0|nr:methyltransferase [Vibrio methylphosphonaticus]MCL9774340.1 SAM-dependent methyltransferase [Vibrio methylphosphonaticus]
MNRQQFQLITRLLKQYQSYWRQDPFTQVISGQIPWKSENPELLTWLQSLSRDTISTYKKNPLLFASIVSEWLPDSELLCTITVPHRLFKENAAKLPRGLDSGIPGRKLQQISSLSDVCISDHHGSQWLEWCAGKGYLGRLLSSQSQQPVTSFEFQATLCESGQSDADKLSLPMTFVQGDAFSEESEHVFSHHQHAVALHACGDLHVTLIKHTVRGKLPAVTLSPCCYHLIHDTHYQPMSNEGHEAELMLSKQELRIPLQETVTGGERVKRHREQEMTFRLGFDALCTEMGLSQAYIPVPSIKKSQLAEGFEAFCRWAANQKQLTLPEADYVHFERIGKVRYWGMEALSLIQGMFRRPLELWLALDKALYLQQQGYHVDVFTFCDTAITPRNLVIHAVRT